MSFKTYWEGKSAQRRVLAARKDRLKTLRKYSVRSLLHKRSLIGHKLSWIDEVERHGTHAYIDLEGPISK